MRSIALFVTVFLVSLSAFNQSFQAVPKIKSPALFNEQLQYTSSLLHQPNAPIRILVYGQSISVQDWWKEVKTYFENKYPTAAITFMNKAIGGFSAERLKLTVANDVVSFYPDLILFHDYGNEEDYEKIIRVIRSKTTADIAIQTDHMALQNQEWHDRHNNIWLPGLCRKYGLALVDVRKYWKLYLKENKLEIKDLLTDGVHLNEQGNYVMAAIIKNYFDNLLYVPMADQRIAILKRDRDFFVKGDSIQLPFTGNRVDVQNDSPTKTNSIRILVDNQSLKNNERCFYYTRPTLKPDEFFLTNIGLLLAMELSRNVREEKWFLTILSIDSLQQQVVFSIKGSLTGEDGTGNSSKVFNSNSGKITIRPDAWFVRKSKGDFALFNWLKPGDVLQWQIKSMCFDSLALQPVKQTILQGIVNTTHQLKITGPGAKHINEIIVYLPPLSED